MAVTTPGFLSGNKKHVPLGATAFDDHSLTNLRKTLGDERASGVVNAIGVAALAAAPQGLPVALDAIVARTIANLTQQDIAGLQRGDTSAMNRVTVLVQEQVKAAQANPNAVPNNIHGAGPINASAAGANPFSLLGRFDRGERGDNSGARFDTISAKGDWNSPAGQAEMRAYAAKLGLSWATGHPDLLRLGPAALEILKEVNLKHENYLRATKELKLDAQTVVSGAHFAKRNNIDHNENIEANTKLHNGLTPPQQLEYQKSLRGLYNSTPENQEERLKGFHQNLDRIEKERPELKKEIEGVRKTLPAQRKAEIQSQNTVQVSAQNNAAATTNLQKEENEKNNLFADFNAPPNPASAPAQKADVAPASQNAQVTADNKNNKESPVNTVAAQDQKAAPIKTAQVLKQGPG